MTGDHDDAILITMADVQKAMEGNPLFQLQAKCMALIRMLEERDARIVELTKDSHETTET